MRRARIVLVAIVLVSVAALLWWYFFLSAKEGALEATDAARGLSARLPSPSGESGAPAAGGSTELPAASVVSGAAPLVRVSKTPVAGAYFEAAGDSFTLYFVERGTGYVFSFDPATGETKRLTNKLFPKTYEAIFTASTSVILRYGVGDDVVTFAGKIEPAAASSTLRQREGIEGPLHAISGIDLPLSIRSIAAIPRTNEVLYVQYRGDGADIVRSAGDGTKRRTLLSLPLSSWIVRALADGRLFLTQRAADDVPGFSYELRSGTFAAAARAAGLSFLPESYSSAALIGSSGGGALSLSLRMESDEESVELPIKTMADKCVWAPPQIGARGKAVASHVAYCAVPRSIPSRGFLSDWYRGAAHTADDWWMIRGDDERLELVFRSEEKNVDVEAPIIDDGGAAIAFRNAADQSLWLLRLPSATASTTPQSL